MKQTRPTGANHWVIPGILYARKNSTPIEIINFVANYFGLQPEDLYGRSRLLHICKARQIAMWAIRKKTNLTYNTIGSIFEDRDHATVLYSYRTINDMILTNDQYGLEAIKIFQYL